MKRALGALGTLGLFYSLSFFLLRFQLHDSTDLNIATDTGNRRVHEERTSFWIPGTGAERPAEMILYLFFYPAGQVDRLATGRVYHCTDSRNIVL